MTGTSRNVTLSFVQEIDNEAYKQYSISQFYKYLGLPSNGSKSINVGYTLLWDNPKFIVFYMKNWVNFIDEKLLRFREGTTEFADIFGLRGFTFDEFRLVLSSKLKKENYKRHRVFDYLFLTDSAERDFYNISNLDDDNEILAAYIKAIKNAIETEIWVLCFLFTRRVPLYFPTASLRQGVYILGLSGSGKSTLLKTWFFNLQRRSQRFCNRSLVLIEPAGDLSLEIISFALNIPFYWKRVVYLNPFLRETAEEYFGYDLLGADYTFHINPFELSKNASERDINYLTEELSNAFFSILKNDTTPQMDVLIEACVETLLREEGTDVGSLKQLMNEAENEELLQKMEKIPNVERAKMAEKIRNDKRLHTSKGGIFYRLQKILGNAYLRQIITGKNTVPIEQLMNDGHVIIFDANKTKLGTEASPAFGKLVLSLIQAYAKKRQHLRPEKRKETIVFVDEFQNYTSKSIHEIMEESRKFALHMVLSQQYAGQGMDSDLRRSITSNTALKIASDNDADSLKFMCENMGDLTPKDFDNLPPYSFYTYDKKNKKAGVQTLRIPDFLVDINSDFYQSKESLKNYFLWLANKSGYYRRVEQKATKELPKPQKNLNNSSGSFFFNPKFDDQGKGHLNLFVGKVSSLIFKQASGLI